jgi:hypothetical protein
MEKQNSYKNPISLVLSSYNILISSLVLFIFLVILMLVLNPKGFNSTFGYEVLITGPVLFLLSIMIKELFVFKNNPTQSWLSTFSQSKEKWFLPVYIIGIILIGLAGFFSVLTVAGIFSDKPPENNVVMLINFLIIILFVVIASAIYNSYKKKDDINLQALPRAVQEVFALRTKYTLMFVLFALAITCLYFVNPFGIMTNYGGPVVFFTIFVGMILTIMITIYQYYMANPSKANMFANTPGFFTLLFKGLYILAALGISFGLIYGLLNLMGIFNQDEETWGHLIFNLLLFSAMLGIIYKLANAGGFLDKNPYYRLILNTLLYIPCLLVTLVSYLSKLLGFSKDAVGTSAFAKPNPFETKMLVISLLLLSSYFFWIYLGKHFVESRYLKQGGKQLINNPVQTDVLTNVSTYQNLSDNDKFNYQYAMSFWFYLDSFPPSTNASYNKIVDILSYGKNPSVKYSSSNNTLYITVKQKTDADSVVDFVQTQETDVKQEIDIKQETIDKWNSVQDKINDAIEKVKTLPFGNEVDADGNRIIYKHPDVKLQKWNHVLLNYNGGTLDVFYNGKLVKSAIEVVPYLKYDMLTVGTENGVSGNVANLMYFKQPLDLPTINTLYVSLKNKNPPTISSNKQHVIPPIAS